MQCNLKPTTYWNNNRNISIKNIIGRIVQTNKYFKLIPTNISAGGEPTCKFVDCGLPEAVVDGHFVLSNNATSFGSVVTYACNDHFRMEGNNNFLGQAHSHIIIQHI
jgi:hypothetical protein